MTRKFIGLIKVFKLLLLILLLNTLYACVVLGPLYREAQLSSTDNALIYIYRPDKVAKVLANYSIYINDKFIAELANNGYVVVEINPRDYTVAVRRSKGYKVIKKQINLNKSDVVYIKYEPINDINLTDVLVGGIIAVALTGSSGGGGGGSNDKKNRLDIIDSEIAKQEIASTRLQKHVDFTKLKEKQCNKKGVTHSKRFIGIEAGCERL